jgi:predicted alpha-1,2-mannosidase
MAQLAKALNRTDDYKKYTKGAQAYRQIFDPSVGWFRPRNSDGAWQAWPEKGRLREGYGCIESNPYQQGWFVPHDVDGMAELMGGREKTLADLTAFFTKTPDHFLWNEYYNHANEPVHHIPFLFNRLGAHRLTQYWTRFICDRAYQNKVEGLVGNEDVGQMSAWYVLAAAGLHPVCPGDTRYEITSPVFDKVSMRVGFEGKIFTVIAHNNGPENVYIDRMLLNGQPYQSFVITHEDIAKGGTLELYMSEK